MHICLGWNFYLSTVLMLVITALYTIAGTAYPRQLDGGLAERAPDHRAGHQWGQAGTCRTPKAGRSRGRLLPQPGKWTVWSLVASEAGSTALATAYPPVRGQGYALGQVSFPGAPVTPRPLLPEARAPSNSLFHLQGAWLLSSTRMPCKRSSWWWGLLS